MPTIMPKISPENVSVAAFNSHRWARVSLRGSLSIDTVRENPGLWARVQDTPATRLAKGDRIDLVSPDGLVLAEGFIVTRALAGDIWLSKPARLINLEADALYGNDRYEVVPIGTAFGIRDKRLDVRQSSTVYPTAAAAESALHRLMPRKVA